MNTIAVATRVKKGAALFGLLILAMLLWQARYEYQFMEPHGALVIQRSRLTGSVWLCTVSSGECDRIN